jgi:hypothetical protein
MEVYPTRTGSESTRRRPSDGTYFGRVPPPKAEKRILIDFAFLPTLGEIITKVRNHSLITVNLLFANNLHHFPDTRRS